MEQTNSLTSVIVFLREHFDMTVENINHFIGIKISWNRLNRSITLSQEPFIHRILKRFGMTNCNPKAVSADPYTNLSEVSLGRDDDDFDQSVYREAVGCVMYVMVCTIAFVVSQVAQFNHQPKPAHWAAVRRILCYLKGNAAFGVTYHADVDAPHTLLAYSDSDYAGDTSSRRSTSGYLLLLNGGPISWGALFILMWQRLMFSLPIQNKLKRFSLVCSSVQPSNTKMSPVVKTV